MRCRAVFLIRSTSIRIHADGVRISESYVAIPNNFARIRLMYGTLYRISYDVIHGRYTRECL